MDEREAFCVAVKIYRSGDWSPALSAHHKVEVKGRHLTPREIYALVTGIKERLPNSIVDDLFERMHAEHIQLQVELALA
jgi:hypothetical protein